MPLIGEKMPNFELPRDGGDTVNLSNYSGQNADETSDLCETMGVWKEKSMYGKTFMGIERSTFLIGTDGTLVAEWRKVKVKGHVDAVLEAVRSL